VPILLLALLVLQCERKDRTTLLDRIFALSIGGEGISDQVESG